MPEGERRLVEFVVAEAPSATAEKPQRRPPAASTATREDAIERVFLPMEDPSEYRPELAPGGTLENLGKEVKNFRVYYEDGGERHEMVRKTYAEMHRYQTVEFGKEMRKKYSGGKADMTIMDAIFMLNNLIDESDPDVSTVDIGNIICAILY
jgi:hypothetical protein